MDFGRAFENLMQNIGTVREGFPEAVPFEAVKGKENYNPESIRRNLMFGTPDEIIEKLLVYEAAGVDQYCLGLTFNLPFDLQRRTLELFTTEIMPFFEATGKPDGNVLLPVDAGSGTRPTKAARPAEPPAGGS